MTEHDEDYFLNIPANTYRKIKRKYIILRKLS